jgi:hypothetical protein
MCKKMFSEINDTVTKNLLIHFSDPRVREGVYKAGHFLNSVSLALHVRAMTCILVLPV